MDSTVIDGTGLAIITIELIQHGIGGTIENFTILGKGYNQGAGILTVKNIIIRNCRIQNDQIGISIINEGSTIEKVIITNISNTGVFGGCSAFDCINMFKNSLIIVNSNNATGLKTASGNYYINNNIILFTGTNSMESGISVGATKKVFIENNLICRFNQSIFFDTVIDTGFIKNNILVYQSGQGASSSIWSSGNKLFANNIILANNIRGMYHSGSGFIRSNYNIFWKNEQDLFGLNYGDSDRVADPMFKNDTIPTANENYDFHLQKYSPAIDKGDPNILDVDGTRSDIGMYGGPFGESYTYQDLVPLAPRNLSAVVDTTQILLKWNHNTEADTAYYKVYRDTTVNFTLDSTKLVSSASDTFFVQLPPYFGSKYVYKITCVDNQGNESKPSEEVIVDLTSVSTDDYPMTINDYLLYPNYPNPFNPSTIIGYKLKERAYVKLMVYDIKGELVTVLVNKEQNAGYYEVEFSSSSIQHQGSSIKGIASGIYLYRIEVIGEGNIPVYTEMKKMLLIK
ncbi:MAG: hypothetical protein KBE38_14830 [Ignavibacterium sp.]|nr:hypothetical protein [Ignavibacterium sp.]